MDVYTLNFFHDDQTGSIFYVFVDYFLALFPVFTLTSSYIIVAITLTNNVKVLLKMIANTSHMNLNRRQRHSETYNDLSSNIQNAEFFNDENETLLTDRYISDEGVNDDSVNQATNTVNVRNISGNTQTRNKRQRESNISQQSQSLSLSNEGNDEDYLQNNENFNRLIFLRKLTLPALVIGLPTLLSFFTDNVLLLASITGSYPGVGVQFIIPSILTLGARSYLSQNFFLLDLPKENASPFRQWFWPYVTIAWAVFAVVIVSTNIFHLG